MPEETIERKELVRNRTLRKHYISNLGKLEVL